MCVLVLKKSDLIFRKKRTGFKDHLNKKSEDVCIGVVHVQYWHGINVVALGYPCSHAIRSDPQFNEVHQTVFMHFLSHFTGQANNRISQFRYIS